MEQGHWSFTLLAFLVGIAFVIVALILLPIADWTDNDRFFGTFAFLGVLIAGVGAIVRAMVHGRKDRVRADHVGKLFTVTALTFSFIGAAMRILSLDGLPFLGALIALGVVALAVIGLIGWIDKRKKQKRTAIAD